MIAFEVVAEEVKWRGRLLRAGVETYHYSDGTRNTFDRVWHPGAVAVIAYDDAHVWLVRQPREAARLHASLELPAGKRDRDGESPLELARRELAEEVGKRAGSWRELFSFYPSAGYSDEQVTLFAATGLGDLEQGASPEEDEHIEIVPWPLGEIAAALAATVDAKTLIGLLWLERELGR